MTTPPRSPLNRVGIVVLVAVLAAVAGVLTASQLLRQPSGGAPTGLAATYIPGGKPVGEFNLLDHHGGKFDAARLRGKWTFLFAGYTYCPDVCPTTMANMAQAYERITAELPQVPVQVVFLTVDPRRDTPERLAQYVPFYNPDFVGVTGADGDIQSLTRSLGLIYKAHDPLPGQTGYLVDHSSAMLLINPEGQLQALFRPPLLPQVIEADFRKIVAAHNAP